MRIKRALVGSYVAQVGSKGLKGAQANSLDLKGSAGRNDGRKKTQQKGQRGKILKMTGEEEEKSKHRSAL